MKEFQIINFPEGKQVWDFEAHITKNEDIPVKVSRKAMLLAIKSQKLAVQHNEAVRELMTELNADNPDVDFNIFESDDFSFFTGENLV